MIWHIATKEIYHHFMTLRFALMIILLPLLMVANALIYGLGSYGYKTQINDYNRYVTQNDAHIKENANKSLAELALVGPGELPKRPSRLTFCAEGADEVIPRSVKMKSERSISRSSGVPDEDYAWRHPLSLAYPLQRSG